MDQVKISIKISETIKDIVGFDGILEFDDSKPDGNPRKLLDSSLIFEKGWNQTSLEDGLTKTYKWLQDNQEIIRF